MGDVACALSRLRTQRRCTTLQLGVTGVLTPLVLSCLWSAELGLADARWLAGIGAALVSWAIVRTVADAASLLEELCPSCGECFFGGLARAAASLPLPPRECVSCRIGLDGSQPGRRPVAREL
jgi:hypothetical protein